MSIYNLILKYQISWFATDPGNQRLGNIAMPASSSPDYIGSKMPA
jgi:hypothetical protein